MADFSSHAPGTFSWPELVTTDQKAAVAFYRALFGWDVQEKPGVGMMPMPEMVPAEKPPYWLPYFQAVSCDASTEKAKTLGATALVDPRDIPNAGRFSVIRDPQGAVFAVFTPKA